MVSTKEETQVIHLNNYGNLVCIERNTSPMLKGYYEHHNRRNMSSKGSEANLTFYTVWRHKASTINKKQDAEHHGT